MRIKFSVCWCDILLKQILNFIVSFQIIRHNLWTKCKCHGMSGNCNLKTCWLAQPGFQQVSKSKDSDFLIFKYQGFSFYIDRSNMTVESGFFQHFLQNPTSTRGDRWIQCIFSQLHSLINKYMIFQDFSNFQRLILLFHCYFPAR